MATIPGSHFVTTAPGLPVNVVETATGTGLPATVPGAFNLEVFGGGAASAPGMAPGYQGFAVLSPSGLELDLISGAFAVTDNGTGNDTISAFGANETIVGGGAGVTLNLFGHGETARGGSGSDTINVFGSSDSVTGGTGNDTINIFSSHDTVTAGSGSDTINVLGSSDTINSGTGADLINLIGSSSQINQGTGSDTINVIGSADTVSAGANAGANQGLVNFVGANMTLADAGNKFTDTVVGFDQSAGDRIHLTTDTAANAVAHSTQVNGGADTLITLSDGSTILMKGVAHIDSSFFS
jgi:Ca2+-binding RTX toxin-like protein